MFYFIYVGIEKTLRGLDRRLDLGLVGGNVRLDELVALAERQDRGHVFAQVPEIRSGDGRHEAHSVQNEAKGGGPCGAGPKEETLVDLVAGLGKAGVGLASAV